MINIYIICGIGVKMTAAMAERWNSGAWTREDDHRAMVQIPDRYEQASRLIDGEVRYSTPRLLQTSEEMTMAVFSERYRGIYRQMEGESAWRLEK